MLTFLIIVTLKKAIFAARENRLKSRLATAAIG